jgi:hypothetical protein
MIPLTKREAAIRQLDAAIKLFFGEGDMIAVHTLVGASLQVMLGLGHPQGIQSCIRSSDYIYEDRLKYWISALNRTQNFLKHADKDRDEVLQYSEESTILLIMEAVILAETLSLHQGSKAQLTFKAWFFVKYPELIVPEALVQIEAIGSLGVNQCERSLWAKYLVDA